MRHITLNSAMLALLISSPAMWNAASGQGDPKDALMRYLAALAFASIGLAIITSLLEAYRSGHGNPDRRETDNSDKADQTTVQVVRDPGAQSGAQSGALSGALPDPALAAAPADGGMSAEPAALTADAASPAS